MSRYNQWDSVKFISQEEAIKAMFSLEYGNITGTNKIFRTVKSIYGKDGIERDTSNDNYFTSETFEYFYNYIIEKHEDYFILKVNRTFKHKMITASIIGDLEMFKDNFDDREKIVEFSLSKAIQNNHWLIVEYIIDNYDLNDKPTWISIKFDRVDILKRLLSREYKMRYDWLAFCIHNNSLNVTRELIGNLNFHLQYTEDEIKTRWLEKQLKKDTEIVKYLKSIIPNL